MRYYMQMAKTHLDVQSTKLHLLFSYTCSLLSSLCFMPLDYILLLRYVIQNGNILINSSFFSILPTITFPVLLYPDSNYLRQQTTRCCLTSWPHSDAVDFWPSLNRDIQSQLKRRNWLWKLPKSSIQYIETGSNFCYK